MRIVGGNSDPEARGPFILEDQLTRGLSFLHSAARFVWGLLTCRNFEARCMFLPVGFIAHFRWRA